MSAKFLFIVCGLILAEVLIVASFSFQTCGDKSDPIKVVSLDVYSNSSKILYVSGRAKLGFNLTAPISGKVQMFKKFFWGWTIIPCVEEIGSCTYDDVCELSPFKENCPQEFIDNGLPCNCPIFQGQYTAKRVPIDLNAFPKWIETGKYRLKVTLYKNETELLCLIMNISI